ncbi:TlpA family protein disulfide reductase [Marinifilum sp. D737]|uniref:TlpA family protein disulfide reductase n=1 Tax=Marinifilum sp. D737 TaxID=2969628 RepID=UPI0022724ADA|nr:TlpA disulfide reductase family protein [Marinifilum sp. D737]MCY1636330.1 TlpA family protein disulfide reductase [Marinifilum sp. D737]
MRNLTVFVMLLTLFACSKKNPKEVVFKGQISNYTGENILLSYDGQIDTVLVGENGVFQKILHFENNTFVFLRGDKLAGRFFLMPGYDLEFTQDVDRIDQGINFINRNVCVSVNKYLIDKYELEDQLRMDRKEYFSMEEAEFISKTEENYDKRSDLLTKLLEDNKKIDPVFVKEEKGSLKYSMLLNYLQYESSHARYVKDYEFKAGEAISKKLTQEELNRSDLLNVSEYKSYLDGRLKDAAYQYYKEHPEYKEIEDGYYIAMYDQLAEWSSTPEIKSYLAATIADARVRWSINENSPVLKMFRKYCSDEKALNRVNEKVACWMRLSKGKDAFDFTGQTIEGKSMSLSDLKGKYVYVDVWATWCGPCCGEIPYLQKTEKEYHDKNIVFLSVSVDRDIDKWKKKVNDDKLGGIQINVGQRNSISKDYMITGIPRFMLFDKEGKIVSVNAPRPSQKEKIEKLFNSLNGL